MTFWDFFWLGYSLTSNPNKPFRKGWDDALAGNPRYQFKIAYLFKFFNKTQDLYDKGYREGLNERLIRKI